MVEDTQVITANNNRKRRAEKIECHRKLPVTGKPHNLGDSLNSNSFDSVDIKIICKLTGTFK